MKPSMQVVKGGKVEVSMRALLQRINRKLAAEDLALKAARGDKARQSMGDYFILDLSRNAVMGHNVDPEAFGRELEVLQPWEMVVEA